MPCPEAGPAPGGPAWRQRLALTAILALALGLRLVELERCGWGAEYYTAAVRSMALGWHNFFFAAFDPAGFISVDKPPLALWLQVLSVKLLGFSPLAVLLPQVLAGVAAVAVLYAMARPRFGAAVGLMAAFLLAFTPVWVAANRTNNTDSCLLLMLLLAGWALIKAAETSSRPRLCLALALIGLGFNVKMLAACIVLPGFALVYWLGAAKPWPRRLMDLGLAGLVFVATALPWVLAVELTPPAERPYIGSSRTNSMLELIVGHNAGSRFISHLLPAAPFAPAAPA
ncbi:MAG: glycosyltransferase family 39 protein, partial [Pseudomonadota bacterium]